MAKSRRGAFLKTLNPDERERYEIALAWYNAIYKQGRSLVSAPSKGSQKDNLTLKQVRSILAE
jgi:hypothetical protein